MRFHEMVVEACTIGNIDTLQLLLRRRGKRGWLSMRPRDCKDGLLAAVKHGHIHVVKELLAAVGDDEQPRTNVNAWFDPIYDPCTALCSAIRCRHASMLKVLLEAHADPLFEWDCWAHGNLARNAFTYASEQDDEGIKETLLKCTSMMTKQIALRKASFYGQASAVELLLSCEERNSLDISDALEYAVRGGHIEAIIVLLICVPKLPTCDICPGAFEKVMEARHRVDM